VIAVLALCGLILGTLLNQMIARQLRDPEAPAVARPASPLRWLPVVGSIARRDWVALAVEALAAAMTVVLWQRYGWTPRFGLLLAATLVLLDTAAIDWQVRLIDTLVMVVATIACVALGGWISGSWLLSLLGALAAGFVFILFFVIAKILYPSQHAPFGLGDVYLGMFIGALLGLVHVGGALLYGMIMAGLASIGIIVVLGYQRARHVPISYGSFLCLGVLAYLAIWSLPV
jgi:leader peptidase (prepilin peptidase) / N-methyltransferase